MRSQSAWPELHTEAMTALKRIRKLALSISALIALSLLLGAAPGRAQQPFAMNHLTLAGGEVSIAYPSTLGLAVTAEQVPVGSTIPPCDENLDYCFYLPESYYVGNNLSAAGLRVSARPDLSAEISCLLSQPDGYSDLQPGVVRTAEGSSSRFAPLGEGAAGSYSEGELRRLWLVDDCYEFETRLVLSRYENYDPGAITEFTLDDQAALDATLIGVIESASSSRGPVVWPLAGHSQLVEFIRLSQPEAGATVASPLTVSGEVVGNWLFEATFPLRLVTDDGEVIADGYATSEGDWMTTDFVAFKGVIEFEVKQSTSAVLVLMRGNASGLPQHDTALRLPLMLEPR